MLLPRTSYADGEGTMVGGRQGAGCQWAEFSWQLAGSEKNGRQANAWQRQSTGGPDFR